MTSTTSHPFVGMWVTADGHIRQELRADGRYDEARGSRRSAYTGRYTVEGNHIDYADDTGFTATGDVRDGVLYHEHLVLYREEEGHLEGQNSRVLQGHTPSQVSSMSNVVSLVWRSTRDRSVVSTAWGRSL